jgi:hypothetical protein
MLAMELAGVCPAPAGDRGAVARGTALCPDNTGDPKRRGVDDGPVDEVGEAGSLMTKEAQDAEFTWRLGQDFILHAIKGCDPNASAWAAECGKLVTGAEEDSESIMPYCRECLDTVK